MAIKRLDFTKRGFSVAEAVNATFWEEIDWHKLPSKAKDKLVKKCIDACEGDIFTVRTRKHLYKCIWCSYEPDVVEAIACRRVRYKRGNELFEVYFSRDEGDEHEAVAFGYQFMQIVGVVPITACRNMEWEDLEALVRKAHEEAFKFIDKDKEIRTGTLEEIRARRHQELRKAKELWEERNGTGCD